MTRFFLVFLCLLLSYSPGYSQLRSTLVLDQGWQLSSDSGDISLAVSIPNYVQEALMDARIIPDPFYGTNEKSIQWVSEKTWTYSLNFKLKTSNLKRSHKKLVLEGIDTFSEIYLNSEKVLTTDNMFRKWEIDLEGRLQKNNTLEIKVIPPAIFLKERMETFPYKLHAPNEQNKEKFSIHSRKAPFHFGWDWGPELIAMGVWKPIKLEFWDQIRVPSVKCEILEVSDELATLQLAAEVDASIPSAITSEIWVNDSLVSVRKSQLQAGSNTISHPLTISNPIRWWPIGLGDPYLYDIRLELKSTKGDLIHSQAFKKGIRTVELVQEPDSIGTSFFFKINGHSTFMKGANYIPSDPILSRVSRERIDFLLESALAANMNMLRVWGGGIYESDYFYEKCDESGLMVWQDFMFACSMYPGDSAFLENVRMEALQQVERISSHPSVVLWCGNNEVEVAWKNWGWQARYLGNKTKLDAVWKGYTDTFHELLPSVVGSKGHGIPYISTSPLSNWGKKENFNHHNMHYWGVWHGDDKFEEFNNNVPRFMSEFGFQSFPHPNTISAFCDSSQLDLDSETMKWHQKSYRGNGLITRHMKDYYRIPDDFLQFSYLSQVLQADAMKTAWQAHRTSNGHCMGTLYWQLDDCWPGPSWSGIDYYGNWKATHYAARDYFHPQRIFIDQHKNRVTFQLVNEAKKKVSADIRYRLVPIQGNEMVSPWTETQLNWIGQAEIKLKQSLFPGKPFLWNPKNSILQVQMIVNQDTIQDSRHFFLPAKDIRLPNPGINLDAKIIGDNLVLHISSQNICSNLMVYSDGHHLNFDQNFLNILPGETKILTAKLEGSNHEGVIKNLRYLSLYDTQK